MLDNIGLRYPHRASGAKAPRTLRLLPLLRFAVSATGGAHLCSIQYYLRFWLSSCRAYDLTGAEEAELASQLQAGNPVIFWATLHFGDIQHDPCGEYDLPGGRRHEVLHTLHCMVLCGMDDQNFVVADPLDFNRVVPRVQFMKIYRQLGRRAVVIKKDS